MKIILTILLIGILVMAGGCSNAAGPSGISSGMSVSEPEASAQGSSQGDMNGMPERPSDVSRENNQNEILGKIAAISGSEITLEIGVVNRPDNAQGERGAPPTGEGSRPDGEQPPNGGSRSDGTPPAMPDEQSGGSMPQGERPAGGNRDGSDGGSPGGFMDLEYTGEEISYTLSDTVEITKGMSENNKKLAVSDLAEGNIIRLLLDEAEQPVSIQVFEIKE